MSSIHLPSSVIDEAALLGELGISVPRQVVCRTAEVLRGAAQACSTLPGDRVVLKVTRPHIAHKTEAGAVRVVARTEQDIGEGIQDLALRLDATEVAITQFVEHDLSPGGELLLTIRWTEELGPLVTFGAGGVTTELMSSFAVFAPDIAADVEIALRGKAFARLVTGYRRQKPRIPMTELRRLIQRCLTFAADRLPHSLTELEINPLVPTPRGLVALDVLIAPGRPESKVAVERPVDKIHRLLHPRSVAVMGVSATSMNAGRIIARSAPASVLIKADAQSIDGIPCVPDIASMDPVDLIVLSIPAEQVPAAVDEIIVHRAAEAIVAIPGAVTGELERQVRSSLEQSRRTPSRGPVLNGANCLGVLTPDVNTIFLPPEKFTRHDAREVPLAVVSQSGALSAVLQTKLVPYAPRYVVSIGNQLDLTVGDYLQHFSGADDVQVLAFYVEGFAPLDGRKWFQLASKAVRDGKTVILYRAGRTTAGQRATSSHTAAMAGDAVVTRELARATGVLYAETLDDFTDLILTATLLRQRRPTGIRLGAMSNAGFESVAIADNHGRLELAPLTGFTREAMVSVLRESRLDRIVSVTNPLDVNPMLGDAAFSRVAELLLLDDTVDLAVIGCVPLTGALRTLEGEIASEQSVVKMLTLLWRVTSKPWVVSLDAGPLYDAMAWRLVDEGVPVFRTADRAVRALGTWSATLLRA